jgi:SAM-dependent methyltransferase
MTANDDHVRANRAYWDERAHEWVALGKAAWQQSEPSWGIWSLPESSLRLLPADMSGMTAIELGCGTAYVSAWMARRGAAVVGIDNTERQLATARELAAQHGVALTLLHGNAETVPCADSSFDFAISEYGAAIWCEPAAWIGEVHRLLRPGGEHVFLGNHPLALVCSPIDGSLPATERLERAYFDLGRLDWRGAIDEPGGIEFNLPISSWMRLFHQIGFDVIDYIEIQAPESATGTRGTVTAEWAKRFPSEQVWRIKKP